MSIPAQPASQSRTAILVSGIAVAIAVALVLWIVLSPSSSSSSSPPGYSIVGHTGVVNNETPVQTSPISVVGGSLVVLFVSWVNVMAGGGGPTSISDSLGDAYTYVTSSGYAYNHTEAVYVADVIVASSSFVVTIPFTGGATAQGGSIAVVDVANASVTGIDGTVWVFGDGATATVGLTTNHTGDLVLLGAAGRGVSGPYAAVGDETLLDTGTATAGPFQDGVAYGTFSTTASGTSVELSASLSTPTYWVAVGVAIR